MHKEANPLNLYLRRNLKGIHYTVSEAAELVGKSADTLRRWRQTGFMVPSKKVTMGEQTIYVYTEADIERLRVLAQVTKRGKRLDRIKS